MSWGLFIGGIMTGVVAVWVIIEKIKYDTAESKRAERELSVKETNVTKTHTATMTEEEFNAKMDALFEIFSVKE